MFRWADISGHPPILIKPVFVALKPILSFQRHVFCVVAFSTDSNHLQFYQEIDVNTVFDFA